MARIVEPDAKRRNSNATKRRNRPWSAGSGRQGATAGRGGARVDFRAVLCTIARFPSLAPFRRG